MSDRSETLKKARDKSAAARQERKEREQKEEEEEQVVEYTVTIRRKGKHDPTMERIFDWCVVK